MAQARNARLYETQRELFAAGKEVTAARIRSMFNGQPEDDKPTHTILEVYQYHNDQFSNFVGKDFASGTLKKYKTTLKSIQDFIKEKYKKADLPITELNNHPPSHVFATLKRLVPFGGSPILYLV